MYIIAEAGINHNGDLDLALAMCEQAKAVGADCIKFQMYTMDNLFIPEQLTKQYKALMPVLEACMLERKDFEVIRDHCQKIGIDWTATPEDVEGAKFLMEQGVPFIKVGSRQALNFNYLNRLSKLRARVLMSRGLSDAREAEAAILLVEVEQQMLCVSKYPATAGDYFEKNPRLVGAGLSDHTAGIGLAIRAAETFRTLEKHFTLDPDHPGPDHAFSLPPHMFKIMVDSIREVT